MRIIEEVVSHVSMRVCVARLNALVLAGNRGSSNVCARIFESHVSMRVYLTQLTEYIAYLQVQFQLWDGYD